MKTEKYVAKIKEAKTEKEVNKLIKKAVADPQVRVADIFTIDKEAGFRNHELSYQAV